jgi:thiol:disulfide interchange protein DsbC
MGKTKLAVLLATGLITSCVGAQNSVEATIKKNIEPRLGGAKIESIKETPYGGLYELRVAGDILYTDKKGDYLIIGHVYDAKTTRDLTRERIDDINKIKFSDLPLDSAIKQVKGDGKRVIAVTIYTFMYNILSEDSFVKSKNIWCSPDRSKAWDEWMISGKAAPAAAASCQTPNDKVLALGQKLKIQGTPAIFFADGSRIPGAVDQATLEKKLESIKQ